MNAGTHAVDPGPAVAPALAPVLSGLGEVLRPAVALYVDLHHHPELSGEERRTAGALAKWLGDAGYEVTGSVGGHGVVGVLRNGEGPRVMIRTELDALPLTERTGLPYASEGPVAHACGHDLHMAAAMGAASLLARTRDRWSGTVVVVCQPAEETLTGARAMLADGLYERFGRPDVVMAQHAVPLPAGMIAHGYGPMLAGSAGFEITVHGRGGHAGTPHLAVDPVLAASAAVVRLQGAVSRECAPGEHVTLNVGAFHAGTAGNLIPDRADLSVTVRALSESTLDRMTEAVRRIVRAECAASGCPRDPELRTVARSPVTHPDPETTGRVRAAHESLYGPHRISLWPPSFATEDYPLYGDAGTAIHGQSGIPLAYWMLGTISPKTWSETPGTPAEKLTAFPPNHSPEFAPDVKTTLPTGIGALVSGVWGWVGN
ncbi:amidohydrolase [Streptomyces sp. NPDC058001]|uniref:amidohydrolase n=1 Tax=Streptomyces sp. NPDC058001 TaxID=3346300 RepID=UPI0036EEC6BE